MLSFGFRNRPPSPILTPGHRLRVPPHPDQTASTDHNESGRVEITTEQVAAHAITNRLSPESFREWYQEYQIEQNLLNGNPYFNTPPQEKAPTHHTPSRLLECHRKAFYHRRNAPREGDAPAGVFWLGSRIEEDLIVPYLRAIVPDGLYIQNSLWINTELDHEEQPLQLRGATDPAVVEPDGSPILVTEIKTTSNIDQRTEPQRQHLAQLHAYLYGLNQEYEHKVTDGVIIYVDRKSLAVKHFPVTFNEEIWHDVRAWMAAQTPYEAADELPPAEPTTEWECSYCAYANRCGNGDAPFKDTMPTGLLPLFDGYARSNLVDYLDAHAADGAKLTPTLAYRYPELADIYDVYDWSCPGCGQTFAVTDIEWDGAVDSPPPCPACRRQDTLVALSGPAPDEQHPS